MPIPNIGYYQEKKNLDIGPQLVTRGWEKNSEEKPEEFMAAMKMNNQGGAEKGCTTTKGGDAH
jgi:hypothetical protein